MNEQDLKMIQAQLAYLLMRLEKLEYRVKGGFKSASVQSYVDELQKEAAKIVAQIR